MASLVERYNGWIAVKSPWTEGWEQQEIIAQLSAIVSVKLYKKLKRSAGPENAVEIVYSAHRVFERGWIRCETFEQAEELYGQLKEALGALKKARGE